MHRLDRVERNGEVAGILHVDYEFMRRDFADRAEFLAAVGSEGAGILLEFFPA